MTYVLHRIIEVPSVYLPSKEDLDKLYSASDKTVSLQIAKRLEEEFFTNNEFIESEFGKTLQPFEESNFDFYVALQKGHRVLFDIKYTESEFGKVERDDTHFKKYNEIYKPRLLSIVRPEYLTLDFVFDHYQIIRTLSYIDDITTVVFLFPKENQSLMEAKNIILKILQPKKQQKVRIVFLEEIITKIISARYLEHIKPHFEKFKEKYID